MECASATTTAAETGDYSVILCTACRIRVYGVEARNAHYKSDLHRVNLKRKVLGLAPLPQEEYERLLAEKQAEESARAAATGGGRRAGAYCEVCAKKFSSVKAMQNHTRSRRHLDALRRRPMSEVTPLATEEESLAGDELDSELDEHDIEARLQLPPIPPCVCVFDGHVSASPEDNAAYMASTFGFFLPFVEALDNLDGLLTYLGQKVGIGFACVECDRPFTSLDAVRHHMRDKQHCRMTDDDDVWVEEYAEFYDFERTANQDDNDDDEGWEEVGDEEAAALETNSSTQVVAVVDEDTNATYSALSRLQPVIADAADDADEEVSLVVNGKALGHRSLRRYYRQSYAPNSGRNITAITRVLGEYRLLGWKGQNLRPTREVKAAVRVQQVRKRKFELKVGESNYYTRKSSIKPSMQVFNSGYRP